MNIVIFVGQDRFFLSHVKDRAEFFAHKGFNVYVLGKKNRRTVRRADRGTWL